MIEFSLEKYLANPDRKVLTRSGREVRIVATDMRGRTPILAVISCPEAAEDAPVRYGTDGRMVAGATCSFDLFFEEKKKCVEYRIMDRLGDIESTGYSTRDEAELMTHGRKDLTVVKITWEE